MKKITMFLMICVPVFLSCHNTHNSLSNEVIVLTKRCDSLELKVLELSGLILEVSKNQEKTVSLQAKQAQIIGNILTTIDYQQKSIYLMSQY